MTELKIPIEFFKAVGEKPAVIRIIWVKWLADYTEHLFKDDFCDMFFKDMEGKKLDLETIKQAYDFGMPFFKDGFYSIDTKKKNTEYSEIDRQTISKVIDYLNVKSNSTYTVNKSNSECIHARIKEGYSISDFFKVIDNKVQHWKGTEQEKYLRPITLFQAKKFENYLNEPQITKNGKTANTGTIAKLTSASEKAKSFFR
jgi:uncharacterized phage protein (TIGR02220 family)